MNEQYNSILALRILVVPGLVHGHCSVPSIISIFGIYNFYVESSTYQQYSHNELLKTSTSTRERERERERERFTLSFARHQCSLTVGNLKVTSKY